MGMFGEFVSSILGGAFGDSRQLKANYTVYIQQKIKKLPSKCTLNVVSPSRAKYSVPVKLTGCDAVLVDDDGEFCGALFPRLHALSGYEIGDRVECVVRKPPVSGDMATVEFDPSPKKRSLDDRTVRFNLTKNCVTKKIQTDSGFLANVIEIPVPSGSSAKPHIGILNQGGKTVAEITARSKAYKTLLGLIGENHIYTDVSAAQSDYGEDQYFRFRMIMRS